MRIGIYSGTFDPIHEGHILFAHVACEQFGIEKILLLPEPKPRYKENVTDIEKRIEMCQLASLGVESEIHTLAYMANQQHTINGLLSDVAEDYPEDEYYILMGSDVFRRAPSWGERDDEDGTLADIANSVGFIIGVQSINEVAELKEISQELGLNVRYVEIPLPNLASSKIREKFAARQEPIGLNDEVTRYIKQNKLYGSN